jgi:hypothetical protein
MDRLLVEYVNGPIRPVLPAGPCTALKHQIGAKTRQNQGTKANDPPIAGPTVCDVIPDRSESVHARDAPIDLSV